MAITFSITEDLSKAFNFVNFAYAEKVATELNEVSHKNTFNAESYEEKIVIEVFDVDGIFQGEVMTFGGIK